MTTFWSIPTQFKVSLIASVLEFGAIRGSGRARFQLLHRLVERSFHGRPSTMKLDGTTGQPSQRMLGLPSLIDNNPGEFLTICEAKATYAEVTRQRSRTHLRILGCVEGDIPYGRFQPRSTSILLCQHDFTDFRQSQGLHQSNKVTF